MYSINLRNRLQKFYILFWPFGTSKTERSATVGHSERTFGRSSGTFGNVRNLRKNVRDIRGNSDLFKTFGDACEMINIWILQVFNLKIEQIKYFLGFCTLKATNLLPRMRTNFFCFYMIFIQNY